MKKFVEPVAVILKGDVLYSVLDDLYNEFARLNSEIQLGEDDINHFYGYVLKEHDYCIIEYPQCFEIYSLQDVIIC